MQKNRAKPSERRFKYALVGALVTTLISLAFWRPIDEGGWLDALSYDLPFAFVTPKEPTDVMIVRMDDQAHRALDQPYGKWSRSLHADLLDVLTRDQAELVVFDIYFADPGRVEENEKLSAAIKRNGKVILASNLEESDSSELNRALHAPRPDFADVASGVGIHSEYEDLFLRGRKIFPGWVDVPSLAWIAASKSVTSQGMDVENPFKTRWFNYYGPPGKIQSVSYADALRFSPGVFSNKTVFIGGYPNVRTQGEIVDEFHTPFSRWGSYRRSSGVELHATAFTNLVKKEWLERMTSEWELILLLFFGILFGVSFVFLRPIPLLVSAFITSVLVFGAACFLTAHLRIWSSWMLVAGVQVPVAVLWALVAAVHRVTSSHRLSGKIDILRDQNQSAHPSEITDGNSDRPRIPNHRIVRSVGRGAFGEVWLAEDREKKCRAIKIIRHSDFSDAESYERAFRGIARYMPISHANPALLEILHFARDDSMKFFYYSMEIADDERSGQDFNLDSYSPKTVSSLLKQTEKLSFEKCIQIAISLTEGLTFLHEHDLVHRDIKPANIIFVNGRPKVADIDLVTDIAALGKTATYLGTFGYIPPEGPGTPLADIYSLGKVLYQMAFRRPCEDFPDLPTDIMMNGGGPIFIGLNEIILKACENDPSRRFQSMEELKGALEALLPKTRNADHISL